MLPCTHWGPGRLPEATNDREQVEQLLITGIFSIYIIVLTNSSTGFSTNSVYIMSRIFSRQKPIKALFFNRGTTWNTFHRKTRHAHSSKCFSDPKESVKHIQYSRIVPCSDHSPVSPEKINKSNTILLPARQAMRTWTWRPPPSSPCSRAVPAPLPAYRYGATNVIYR